MINPLAITNFQRSDRELQTFWIFSICVANKNSDYAARCVAHLLHKMKDDQTPFEYIRELGVGLHNALVASRVGQYTRIERALTQSLDLDLRNCSLDDLLGIFRVGNKTARFFLLHTRADCDHAALDVHILKYLKEKGMENVPQQTPTDKELYAHLERSFIYLAKIDYPGMSLADIDLLIWSKYSGRLD